MAKKDKEKKDIRIRTFMITTNLTHLPSHLALPILRNYLDAHLPKGSQYAFIVHDKDVYTEKNEEEDANHVAGTPKAPHLHLSVYLPNAKTVSAIANMFNVPENMVQIFQDTNGQRGSGKQNLFAYLVHMTEGSKHDGKYEYGFDEVATNFEYEAYVMGIRHKLLAKEISKDMIRERILNGDLRMIDFVEDDIYSAFYLENTRFVDKCIDIKYKREMNRLSKQKVQVIYIEGTAGSGKSTYARRYAAKMYRDYCISSSRNDSVQDYLGQEVMIFDDARPSDFSASDWLKMLDPYNNQSSITSRFYNKYLAVKCIILTSTIPFDEFFVYCKDKGGVEEPIGQFMRRFECVMKVDGYEKQDIKYANVSIYDVVTCAPFLKSVGNTQVDYRWKIEDVPSDTFEFEIGPMHDRLDKNNLSRFRV